MNDDQNIKYALSVSKNEGRPNFAMGYHIIVRFMPHTLVVGHILDTYNHYEEAEDEDYHGVENEKTSFRAFHINSQAIEESSAGFIAYYRMCRTRKICECNDNFIDDNKNHCWACEFHNVPTTECIICSNTVFRRNCLLMPCCSQLLHRTCFDKCKKCPFCAAEICQDSDGEGDDESE
jgi:hypothetical protein